jgi:hypothetical protein
LGEAQDFRAAAEVPADEVVRLRRTYGVAG